MADNKKQKKGRLKYMILSVIISIAIWSIVSYINGPDIENTFHNIRVSYIGTEELRANGCIVMNEGPMPDLSVKVSGKRDELMHAMDKLEIEVDVSGITAPGSYELEGNVHLPSTRLTLERVNFSYIPVTVDELTEKEMTVEIHQIGSISGMLVKSIPSQNKIKVFGAKTDLDKISTAYTTVNIDLIRDGDTMVSDIILADDKGNPIRFDDSISCEPKELSITNTIYTAVKLPVKLSFDYSLSDKLIDESKTTIDPASVTVGVLDDTDISSVTAEVTELSSDTIECTLKEAEGLYIPDDIKTVKVKLAFTEFDDE